jgi:tetratricopeptide (TPR) repeat protein
MKKQPLLLGLLLCAATANLTAQTVVELPQSSQKGVTIQRVGLTDITMEYYRPAVKGRKIWGDLVPFGFTLPTVDGIDKAPWKTGANMNTTISFTHDVTVEGTKVGAGKYGFFIAMHENGKATLVLSKTNSAYGQYFYKEEEDILRAIVNTRSTPHTELFTCSFDVVEEGSTILSLKWDKIEIPVKIEVDVPEIVTASLVEQLKKPSAFSWHGKVQAARYLVNKNIHLDLALQWCNEAINGAPGQELLEGEKNFVTLSAKYNVLFAMGNKQEAKQALTEAFANPGNSTPAAVVSFGRSLLLKDRKEDAQLVFDFTYKKWPNTWEAKHGMARMLSANGKFNEALKYELDVLKLVSAEQKPVIETYIKLLRESKDFN